MADDKNVRLELGTIRFSLELKGGKLQGPPSIEILQDNITEVAPLMPDGTYAWTLTLDAGATDEFEREIHRVTHHGG